MKIQIPEPIKMEHEELHGELLEAIESGSGTGAAAREVQRLLDPHFEKEEEYALPPLGALRALSQGDDPPDIGQIIDMSDKLTRELPTMLAEHRKIIAALDRLSEAAKAENRTKAVRFAEALVLHARNEEEVLYPAAMLMGQYLKMKSGKK